MAKVSYEGAVIPSFVLNFWSLTGLLPYPVRWVRGTPCFRRIKWALRLHTIVIFLLYCYFYVIELISFSRTYREDLMDLEFFTMVLLVYREYYYALPLFVLILLLINRKSFPTLIKAAEKVLGEILDEKQKKDIRALQYGVWVVVLVLVGVAGLTHYAALRHIVRGMAAVIPGASWSTQLSMPIALGGSMSLYTICWVYGLAFSYGVLCFTVPSSLIMTLCVGIYKGFRDCSKELAHITKSSSDNIILCERIRVVRDNHRRLRGLIGVINSTVASVTVLSTFGDIIMPIAIISRSLEEKSKTFEANLQNESQVYTVYCFAGCAIVQCIIRMSVYITMHEEALRAKSQLHSIGIHGATEAVREAARSFEQEIVENPEEMAISGCGFYYVNKNFAATLFGLVFTYLLLIYQQKDQKTALDQVFAEQQSAFHTLTEQVDELQRRLNSTLMNCLNLVH